KCEARAQRWRTRGPSPDRRQAVKLIPNALRSGSHLVRTHVGMRHKHLWPFIRRNQPVPRNWNAVDFRRVLAEAFLPSLKIDRAAERRKHHKLRKGNTGTLRQFLCRLKGIRMVGRKSENEGAENMDTVFLKLAETLHQP